MTSIYDKNFYETQSGLSFRSAEETVPIIVDLLRPASVLDIGCGVGTWCKAFEQAGVAQVHGIDGPWVRQEQLYIRPDQFSMLDLGKAAAPIHPDLPLERFDLVTTFEFLEHVSHEQAPAIVAMIAGLTDTVVLGAAIPGQGGTGHINEQWIDYWAELMAPHGFKPYDFIRPLIWDNPAINSWYKQNIVGFFRGEVPAEAVRRAQEAVIANLSAPPRLVHPGMFRLMADNSPKRLVRRIVKRLIGRT